MSKQKDALQLAYSIQGGWCRDLGREAADELRRLHSENASLKAALFQAQEAAKDLGSRLTKTEGWLNEAMWNYGELKREQLANSEETSSSPVGRRIEMAVTAEREACVEALKQIGQHGIISQCVHAIRARGQL
jgi:hypothetical protein